MGAGTAETGGKRLGTGSATGCLRAVARPCLIPVKLTRVVSQPLWNAPGSGGGMHGAILIPCLGDATRLNLTTCFNP